MCTTSHRAFFKIQNQLRTFCAIIVSVIIQICRTAADTRDTEPGRGGLWSNSDAEQFSRSPWRTVSPTFPLNYSCGWAWVRQRERARHPAVQVQSGWQLLALAVHLLSAWLIPTVSLLVYHTSTRLTTSFSKPGTALLMLLSYRFVHVLGNIFRAGGGFPCAAGADPPWKPLIYAVKPSRGTKLTDLLWISQQAVTHFHNNI